MIYKLSVILLLILAIFMGCSDIDEDQPTKTQPYKEYPDQESWESIITITKDGKRVAEVWAGYICLYNKKKIAVLEDSIHIDFYDRNGLHNSVLTADSGIVHTRQIIWKLWEMSWLFQTAV